MHQNKQKSHNKFDSKFIKNYWLQIVTVVSLVISVVLLIVSLHIQHNTPKPKPKSIPQTAFALDKAISTGDVELKLSSVVRTKGSIPFLAPEGKEYVFLNLSVTNLVDKPLSILPTNDTYLKNEKGDVVYLSPAAITDPFRAGELSPGETINGQLSYLVDTNSTYKFYVDSSWSGGVIPFTLK